MAYSSMITKVKTSELLGHRWDPGYWDPNYANVLKDTKLECKPLGDFKPYITYGPIITGKKPKPVKKGVVIIGQSEIEFTGVDITESIVVKENSEFDPKRSRVKKLDILFPRSGEGSLGKNKVTIFKEDYKANVECFVDIIRIDALNPHYVLVFLKSKFGWYQIFRIINGVGTPNISFDEIKSLEIPLLPDKVQKDIEKEYENVHKYHTKAMEVKGKLMSKGLDPKEILTDSTFIEPSSKATSILKNLISQTEQVILGKNKNIETIKV